MRELLLFHMKCPELKNLEVTDNVWHAQFVDNRKQYWRAQNVLYECAIGA
jgi:hypothetical protein